MKKYKGLFLALITAFVFFLIFLGCRERPDEVEHSLIGVIYVVGNEPFPKLALSTDNGDIYILKCDKAIESELWKMQGVRVIIYYTTMTVELEMKTVNVIRYAVWR